MSAALKVRKTLWAIAWIVVASGSSLLLLGVSSYRSALQAFNCAHAKLGSETLEKLFSATNVPQADADKWDEWAARHDASISWGVSAGLGAGERENFVMVDPGGLGADEIIVPGCNEALSRERYAIRPNIHQEPRAEFGAAAVACGLVVLSVLRWRSKQRPQRGKGVALP
jgi:hypothetical protein